MRWLLGLAVLLGLTAHHAWAQSQRWATWNSGPTSSSASGTVQTIGGPVSFTLAITPTNGSDANGGYYISGVNAGGQRYGIWPRIAGNYKVRACVRV